MPARTNNFQKLVKVINSHLAPTDAKVTESAMLYDSEAKTDREVDILIESTMSGCDIKIGVEVSEIGNPMNVQHLQAFREKHRIIGINKTVVVSKNGFTAPAKSYAEKNHMKLLTFNSAKSENWVKNFERLKGLSVYGRNYFIRSISMRCSTDQAESGFVFNQSVKVRHADKVEDLSEFCRNAFINSQISTTKFKELKENEESGGDDPWIDIGFALEGAYEFLDEQQRKAWPSGIDLRMGYKTNYRALNAKQVRYDDKEMVVGGYFDKEKSEFAHVALTHVNGEITGTLEVGANILPIFQMSPKPSKIPKAVKTEKSSKT
ncbi:hypothetical protein J2W30_006728 [Variovorax boronicumulans]|uniref:restriction endonuclease n=1 Tax=Variovorax boronicumulans TaxID=436515 RepID=UPI00278091C5|nr:restriction endonuclease [Variovorax boronicumulans]MDQ0038940.1 hypothetical protein [Variovorax boronicumulans]